MRLRHIEQAWEGIRHLQDLDVYLQNVAANRRPLGFSGASRPSALLRTFPGSALAFAESAQKGLRCLSCHAINFFLRSWTADLLVDPQICR